MRIETTQPSVMLDDTGARKGPRSRASYRMWTGISISIDGRGGAT